MRCVTDIAHVATLGASASSANASTATGTLTTVDVTLLWTNTAGDGSWAGDLLLEIGAPDGSCVGIGGYDVELDVPWVRFMALGLECLQHWHLHPHD